MPHYHAKITTKLWYRIISTATPRMTTKYSPKGEPSTLERAVFTQGLEGVLRAGGGKTAGRRLKR